MLVLDLERITEGRWGLAGGFPAGVIGRLRQREQGWKACLASEVGTGKPGPWLWENASGLWATGWCNLDYVPGYIANLLTYSLTQLKVLGATCYPWLNKSLFY